MDNSFTRAVEDAAEKMLRRREVGTVVSNGFMNAWLEARKVGTPQDGGEALAAWERFASRDPGAMDQGSREQIAEMAKQLDDNALVAYVLALLAEKRPEVYGLLQTQVPQIETEGLRKALWDVYEILGGDDDGDRAVIMDLVAETKRLAVKVRTQAEAARAQAMELQALLARRTWSAE